jgi:hypothetical protein
MTKWLAIGAAASLVWTGEAAAQMKGLEAARIAAIGRQRTPEVHATHNLRIAEQTSAAPAHIDVGMLVSRDVAPNAVLGLGLVNISGRRKSTATFGISSRPGRRKPAVTFVLHF